MAHPSADPAVDTSPSDLVRHDPYAALRSRDFRYFALGNVAGIIGWQMVSVVVGWELYSRTNSKTALGLVGLVQVIPLLLLALPAGHVVDRHDRRRVMLATQLILAATGLTLGVASLLSNRIPDVEVLRGCNAAFAALSGWLGETGYRYDDPYVPLMFGLLAVNGAGRVLSQPAKSALLPQLVPAGLFANAVTWNSSLFEVSSMAGPAVGGLLVAALQTGGAASAWWAWAYPAVYFANAVLQFGYFVALLPVKARTPPRAKEPLTLASLSAGVRYVWSTKIILATLTLDLLAVILGGAVALLPVYAKDILHVGPAGLGWLRAAPSIGAVSTALLLAHRPPMKKAGRNMLWAVAGFGAATVVFGFSTWFWLSLGMLVLTGALDNVSVVVRHTLVQTLAPDEMRGRVSAVNAIFIGSSNQLGSLESGLTAAAFGTVPAVVLGGVGTIVVTALAAVAWPELRRYGPMTRPPADEPRRGFEPVAAGGVSAPATPSTCVGPPP
jgi:MFS family permease